MSRSKRACIYKPSSTDEISLLSNGMRERRKATIKEKLLYEWARAMPVAAATVAMADVGGGSDGGDDDDGGGGGVGGGASSIH